MSYCPSKLVDPIHCNVKRDAAFQDCCMAVSVFFSVTAACVVNLGGKDSTTGSKHGQILETILAVVAIGISYGAMTSVAQFKQRAENVRREFLDTKLLRIMQGVFTIMSEEAKNAVPPSENPFGLDLNLRLCRFYQLANNYGIDDADLTKWIDASNLIRQDIHNTHSIRKLQSQLSSDAMYGVRRESKSFQTAVVDLDDWCSIQLRSLEQLQQSHHFQKNPRHSYTADCLYKRLETLKGSLEKSSYQNIQSWQYWRSVLSTTRSCLANVAVAAPQTDMLHILADASMVSDGNILAVSPRQVYYIQVMIFATMESEYASLFLFATFLLHLVAWICATCRILHLIMDANFLLPLLGNRLSIRSTSAIFAFSVTLGSYPLLRTCHVLWQLRSVLVAKMTTGTNNASIRDDRKAILTIKRLVQSQYVVKLLRLLATWCGAYSVERSLVMLDFTAPAVPSHDEKTRLWMALGLVSLSFVPWIGSIALESYVFGTMSWYPQLGKDVMVAFHDELEKLYVRHSLPIVQEINPHTSPSPSSLSSLQPKHEQNHHQQQQQQKQQQQEWAWEDVAYEFFHRYPLNLVFPDDWIVSIVQCLQRGRDLDA